MEIKYKLESIAEIEFKMNYEFDYSGLNNDKLQIQVGHEIKPVMDSDKIVIKAKATILIEEGWVMLATNTIQMTFGLSPIKDVITIKGDGTFTSKNHSIIDTFLVAAMGALRGIFMKNLKGSPLENCYIPLIPLENIRKKEK
jgi:hypothetical protein